MFNAGACAQLKRLILSALVTADRGSSRSVVSIRRGSGSDGSKLGEDVDLLKYALWAVCNMCQNRPACEAFGSDGTCGVVMDVLHVFHKTNADITQLALSAITALSSSAINRSKLCNHQKYNLTEVMTEIGSFYGHLNADLKSVLNIAKQRVFALESVGPSTEPFGYDVSSGALAFALRPREDKLEVAEIMHIYLLKGLNSFCPSQGVNMVDARPNSMSKRFVANFNSSGGAARQSGGMRQSSSGSSLSTMDAQGGNEQHTSFKKMSSVALAINKFKNGSGK